MSIANQLKKEDFLNVLLDRFVRWIKRYGWTSKIKNNEVLIIRDSERLVFTFTWENESFIQVRLSGDEQLVFIIPTRNITPLKALKIVLDNYPFEFDNSFEKRATKRKKEATNYSFSGKLTIEINSYKDQGSFLYIKGRLIFIPQNKNMDASSIKFEIRLIDLGDRYVISPLTEIGQIELSFLKYYFNWDWVKPLT